MLGYKTGNDFSADLKRTAHRVRQAVDALPITTDAITGATIHPRRRRLTRRLWDSTEATEAPHLPGQRRHTICHARPRGMGA